MNALKPTITERRRLTRNSMYRFIYDSPVPVSKQQLAASMDFSLPTVHQNIAELLEANLIMPGEIQKSTGGRPAVGYIVNSKVRYSVGIAVAATHLRLLLTDICQNELAFCEIPIDMTGSKGIGEEIERQLEAFLENTGVDPDKILGVGITFPGVIDREKDAVLFSPTLKRNDLWLEDVRKAIRYPVFIENDSTSGGAAEWFGLDADEKKADFVYLFLENGIGGAVFIDGKPYLGSTGRSGEFGHMCIVPGGRVCNCGKRGCLEAYISAFRFTRDLGLSPDEFFVGLRRGDSDLSALWAEVLDYLSTGICNLRLAFDCNVILGGFVSQYLAPYMEQLRSLVAEKNPFEESADYVKLGKYPTKAGMMGVAWHFVQEFIDQI